MNKKLLIMIISMLTLIVFTSCDNTKDTDSKSKESSTNQSENINDLDANSDIFREPAEDKASDELIIYDEGDVANSLDGHSQTTDTNEDGDSTVSSSVVTQVPQSTTTAPNTTTTAPKTTTTAPKTTTTPPKTTTTPPKTTTSQNNSNYSGYAAEVLRLVNVERAKNGLSALTTNTELNRLAQIRSNETVSLFTHNRPDGREFYTVLTDNNYRYSSAGENIAYGQTTPKQVVEGWMDSPGHRANILNSSYTKLGVGVSKNSKGQIYWAQIFVDK